MPASSATLMPMEAAFSVSSAPAMALIAVATPSWCSVIQLKACVRPSSAPFAPSTSVWKLSPPSPVRLVMIPLSASASPCMAACPSSVWRKSLKPCTAVAMASLTCVNSGARLASTSYLLLSRLAFSLFCASSSSPSACTLSSLTTATSRPSATY